MAVGQELVAVLVTSDTQLSVLQIKQHCASKLPRYMIPSDIRVVSSLPRTTSGKIDRVRVKNGVIAQNAARVYRLEARGAAREAE